MQSISHTFNRMAQAVEESFAVKRKAEQTEHELQQNRELTHLIQHHLEEERRNLARELHDELGQSVTAIQTIATSIANKTRDKLSDLHASAQTIITASAQMYDTMHGMVRRLRPIALDNLGLQDALRDLVGTQQRLYPSISFDLQLYGPLEGLGEAVNITVYRVVQECLTNVVKHAQATRAQVLVRNIDSARTERFLEVEVSDDGKGMVGASRNEDQHFGLLGMRERVQALGGELRLRDETGAGTLVEVRLPLAVITEIPA
jgi:two-component system, NarL family, sensor histidine kinase UhpB